jgi:hypothetical protein
MRTRWRPKTSIWDGDGEYRLEAPRCSPTCSPRSRVLLARLPGCACPSAGTTRPFARMSHIPGGRAYSGSDAAARKSRGGGIEAGAVSTATPATPGHRIRECTSRPRRRFLNRVIRVMHRSQQPTAVVMQLTAQRRNDALNAATRCDPVGSNHLQSIPTVRRPLDASDAAEPSFPAATRRRSSAGAPQQDLRSA